MSNSQLGNSFKICKHLFSNLERAQQNTIGDFKNTLRLLFITIVISNSQIGNSFNNVLQFWKLLFPNWERDIVI